jgi:chromosome segregation ATPase
MLIIIILLIIFGLGLIIYALFGVTPKAAQGTVQKTATLKVKEVKPSVDDAGREQKIQRLQKQLSDLEGQLKKFQDQHAEEESKFAAAKAIETALTEQLKRREEWVAKAEAELGKMKSEHLNLSNRFTAQGAELQDEFAKNVNLTRQLREAKSTLDTQQKDIKLKEDQLQSQKHQIENQLNSIKEQLAQIAEFKRKEKISEWIPKEEYNKLSEELARLRKQEGK